MKKMLKYIVLWLFVIQTFTQLHAQSISTVYNVSITVSNLDEALEFYTGVLPFKIDTTFSLKGTYVQNLFNIQDTSLVLKIARLQLGDEHIELMEFHSAANLGRKIPVDSRSNDLWFQHIAIVVSDMQKAYQLLLDHNVTHVSTSPQTLPEHLLDAAGISAFYFRDPDGHNLELINYPEDKGNSKWHEPNHPLYMGIDHTAIAIERTNSSLDFYQDFLGMKIAGKSENYGTEQEHLNQVFGARLKITGLKAASGFGLEFLDYIAPPGGRLYPPDTRPNDIWHWQTSLKSENVDVIYKKAISTGYEIISSGIVTLNDLWPGHKEGFIMRDPDGHALFIYE